jgi:hypothetical protein
MRSGCDNSAAPRRSCCLEVLVLAAGMTGKMRWGEAYQRQRSIDYEMLACARRLKKT